MSSLAVVIPAFNASAVIGEAIDSAWESGAIEVIVVDDGSTDETVVVAKSKGASVYSQVNSGASVARKYGATLVRADFVVFLDADDKLIAAGVARSIAALEGDPEIVVAAGVVVGFSRQNAVQTRFPIRYHPVDTVSLLTKGHGPWPPANAVVRTSALRKAEEVEPPALLPRYADDYELLIRLSCAGKIDVRDDPACLYSMDGGKSVRSAATAIATKEEIRRHYAQALDISIDLMTDAQIAKAAQARIARAQRAAGNWPAFARAVLRWAVLSPSDTASQLASRARLGAKRSASQREAAQ